MEREALDDGIALGQRLFIFLCVAQEKDGITVNELSKRFRCRKHNIQLHLQKLMDKSLVSRKEGLYKSGKLPIHIYSATPYGIDVVSKRLSDIAKSFSKELLNMVWEEKHGKE